MCSTGTRILDRWPRSALDQQRQIRQVHGSAGESAPSAMITKQAARLSYVTVNETASRRDLGRQIDRVKDVDTDRRAGRVPPVSRSACECMGRVKATRLDLLLVDRVDRRKRASAKMRAMTGSESVRAAKASPRPARTSIRLRTFRARGRPAGGIFHCGPRATPGRYHA
jgi:hypothetical protein